MEETFEQIINSNNLASYFIDAEAIEFALSINTTKSLCHHPELFHKHPALFHCTGVTCSRCPFKSINKKLLNDLITVSKIKSLLPNPSVSEIGDINKYFPTIKEL